MFWEITYLNLNITQSNKAKAKVVPLHATEALGGKELLLILHLGTR
jgi:hypothetical protein